MACDLILAAGVQHERKLLEILGFSMMLNGREIGAGNGLAKKTYFIEDAVLKVIASVFFCLKRLCV